MATPTPAMGTAATQSPATSTAATQSPVTGTADGPQDKPMPVSASPIQRKEVWKRKSAHLLRDDEKAGPSREGKEEEDEMAASSSLSLNEL